MRIDSLRLINFRRFKEHSLELASRFNLIVGDNASGKTAILDALSIAASAVVKDKGRPVGKSRRIEEAEIRQQSFQHGQTLNMEPQLPCIVECEGEIAGEKGTWAFTTNSEKGMDWGAAEWASTLAHSLHNRVKHGEPDCLPLISYYGTERLWRQAASKPYTKIRGDSRLDGYKNCLNPASDERRLIEWFRDQEFAALQQKTELPILEACRRAISTCIRDAEHVYFDATLKQLVMSVSETALPATFLSDGYRNMLSMVADIAIRCATLNPQFEAESPLQTNGIVLIDELDLHLHPKWQRQIVTDLMSAFPRIQFIATTHSPFVIQSLPARNGVQLLNLDDEDNRDFSDKSVEDIAESIQGVDLPQRSQRFIDMMEKAEHYFGLLKEESGTSPEEKSAQRAELQRLIIPFSDDPALSAFLKMNELAALHKATDESDGGQA